MVDVTPELLEKIKNQFNQEYEKSSLIKGVLNKIEKGNATYEDANDYARGIGEILSGALTDNLSSDVLPDGKMYYNIANEIFNDVLGNNYELATNVSASVQQVLNEKSGIGLKAITPNVDKDRIDGIVERISNEDLFDNIKWIVGEPIVNFTQSAVDETIKQNSEFQYKAGLRPKIVRKLGGKCCDWCAKLVGEYAYPNVPKDIYRRHENCRCTVEYVEGSMRTNVHTKKTYVEEDKKIIENSALKSGTSKIKNKLNEKEYKEFVNTISNGNENVKNLFVKYADKINDIVVDNNGYYSSAFKEIHFHLNTDGRPKFETLFHEHGHFFDTIESITDKLSFNEIDTIKGNLRFGKVFFNKVASSSDEYLSALRKDIAHISSMNYTDIVAELKGNNLSAGVQDGIEGALGKRISWGHGDAYYNRKYNHLKLGRGMSEQNEYREAMRQLGFDVSNATKAKKLCRNYETASELWANQIATLANENNEETEFMKKYFPSTFEEIQRIIEL